MATLHAQESPSWLDRLIACCGPPSPGLPSPRQWPQHTEKDMAVWSDEPAMMPPLVFAPQRMTMPGPQPQQPPAAPDNDPYGMAATSYAHFPGHSHGHAYSGSGASSASRFTHATHTTHAAHTTHQHTRSGSSRLSRRQQGPPRPQTASSLLSQAFFAPLASLSRSRSSAASASSSSHRPQISAPTNFQHVHSGAFVFPGETTAPPPPPPPPPTTQPPPTAASADAAPHIDIAALPSPLLPPSIARSWAAPGMDGVVAGSGAVTTPSPAHTRNGHGSGSGSGTSGHSRSGSAMSFHLPRRPVGAAATSGTGLPTPPTTTTTTTTPPLPPRSHLRAHSSPAVESMVERIASAMIEMERLQAEIDLVMERQSVYGGSRPTTAYGYGDDDDDDDDTNNAEPLPAVPALPAAAAPSFAERLSTERPKTAPPRNSGLFSYGYGRGGGDRPTNGNNSSSRSGSDGSTKRAGATAAVVPGQPATTQEAVMPAVDARRSSPSLSLSLPPPPPPPVDVPLAPPLPLVLRPPLRKKKSFSRVSTWLFPPGEGRLAALASLGGGGSGSGSGSNRFNAVTNAPRPVTEKDGYYTVLPAAAEAAITPTTPTTATAATAMQQQQQQQPAVADDGSPSTVATLSTWTDNDGDNDDDDDYDDDDYGVVLPVWPRRQAALGTASPTTTTATTTTTTLTPTSASTTTTMTTVVTLAMADGPIYRPADKQQQQQQPALVAALLGGSGSGSGGDDGGGLGGHRPLSVGVAF